MKKLVILFAVVVVTHTVQAQRRQELNDLIRQSFSYFPRIKEMNAAADLNDLRIGVAQSNYLPNVNGTGSYSYVNPISEKEFVTGPNETQVLKFQPYNNYNLNLGVTQLLWDFGKTQAQIEKAKADLLVSKQNTEAAKLQLATQVASIYYSLIYLRKAVTVQDSAISFYERNRKIIEGKIKQGDALQIDLSTMENNIDQEKNRRVEFQRQYNRQLSLMRYTTGQAPRAPLPAVDSSELQFQPPSAPGELSNNPEVLAATERISAARADAKVAERSKAPSLALQAGAGFRNGYQPDIDAMRFNYLGGVTLNVPIFQGGRLRQNTDIAHKTVELNEFSKANLVSTLQKDIESVKYDVEAYDEQIKNSQGQIKVAGETLRLTQARYRQGVVTYLDLINGSTNLQRAYLNKLQYEYQRTLSNIELCRLLGIKFWQE